jgi:hypothetical protein
MGALLPVGWWPGHGRAQCRHQNAAGLMHLLAEVPGDWLPAAGCLLEDAK